ncbi:restriction endonuclease subunit S [Streptomonospora alba]|uniref:restriction endonuclease subunit S n=1 Tax=Streptomonospora alba TaxID=183763 RepID=UPI001EE71243|nr:restriction endonuclease subunit S [Streptomonospora alba]
MWPTVRLKYIAKLTAGGTPKSDVEEYWSDDDYGYPWVSISDMSTHDKVTGTNSRITKKGLVAARLRPSPPKTLLFSMYASLGHTAWLEPSGTWNQAILGITPNRTVDGRFLNYALISIRPNIHQFARSNTQSNLNAEQVGNLTLPNPSMDDQRRIADFLDTETGRIDRLIQTRERQSNKLAERAYAEVSESLFPGILTSPLGTYPWKWLPRLEDSTPLVRLGYVCRIQGGVTLDESRDTGERSVTLPYLRVANVQADHVDLSSVSQITVPVPVAARSTLRAGDVLMTEGGDIDKLGRGTVWRGEIPGALHQNHIFALRPSKDHLDPDYLALLTRSLHGRCYFESTGVRSTNLASTNSSKVLAFPIPLPEVSRQRELVSAVYKSLESIREAKDAIDRQLSLLAERRQALITAAVTGQLDVTTAGRAAVG